jgi:predicted 3-demethylubiquinone-9 3-methyltransferase (glyoxalase superfamily)
MSQKLTPSLWFDSQAEEAATFYVSVFGNSRIVSVMRFPEGAPVPAGTVMTIEFELDGHRFVGINGGPAFTFTEAVSFQIDCADQEEVDYFWERLGDGGEQGLCGWLKDKFGLSWQVVPAALVELMNDPDTDRAGRAMLAMQTMTRIVIADLYAAADDVAHASESGPILTPR